MKIPFLMPLFALLPLATGAAISSVSTPEYYQNQTSTSPSDLLEARGLYHAYGTCDFPTQTCAIKGAKRPVWCPTEHPCTFPGQRCRATKRSIHKRKKKDKPVKKHVRCDLYSDEYHADN
ncbi:hypothetical protein B9Z65_319 [Elsinoe australis]|uniref:Uncharacterized protein n=1 Tax=Elsinoe australis TaxID=40998 RepID=A0A2P7ZQ89_9PEZI|nr:hypothetical protein B9Z65_319 [Elsinoe australis]